MQFSVGYSDRTDRQNAANSQYSAARLTHTSRRTVLEASNRGGPHPYCWLCDCACQQFGWVNCPALYRPSSGAGSNSAISSFALCSMCSAAVSLPPGTSILHVLHSANSTFACRSRSHSFVAFLREYKILLEVIALELSEGGLLTPQPSLRSRTPDKTKGAASHEGGALVISLADLGEEAALRVAKQCIACMDATLTESDSSPLLIAQATTDASAAAALRTQRLKPNEKSLLLTECLRLQQQLRLFGKREELRLAAEVSKGIRTQQAKQAKPALSLLTSSEDDRAQAQQQCTPSVRYAEACANPGDVVGTPAVRRAVHFGEDDSSCDVSIATDSSLRQRLSVSEAVSLQRQLHVSRHHLPMQSPPTVHLPSPSQYVSYRSSAIDVSDSGIGGETAHRSSKMLQDFFEGRSTELTFESAATNLPRWSTSLAAAEQSARGSEGPTEFADRHSGATVLEAHDEKPTISKVTSSGDNGSQMMRAPALQSTTRNVEACTSNNADVEGRLQYTPALQHYFEGRSTERPSIGDTTSAARGTRPDMNSSHALNSQRHEADVAPSPSLRAQVASCYDNASAQLAIEKLRSEHDRQRLMWSNERSRFQADKEELHRRCDEYEARLVEQRLHHERVELQRIAEDQLRREQMLKSFHLSLRAFGVVKRCTDEYDIALQKKSDLWQKEVQASTDRFVIRALSSVGKRDLRNPKVVKRGILPQYQQQEALQVRDGDDDNVAAEESHDEVERKIQLIHLARRQLIIAASQSSNHGSEKVTLTADADTADRASDDVTLF